MMRPHWPAMGLIGRLVAILLFALALEFVASTLLYERAAEFSVRDDEARRLAEHLVIVRRLVGEAPPPARPRYAAELTTDRYIVRWSPEQPTLPQNGPPPNQIRDQVIAWEPGLEDQQVRLALLRVGTKSVITGLMRLPDASWIYFRTAEPVRSAGVPWERVIAAAIPVLAVMLMGGLLIRRTVKPIRSLTGAVERYTPGEALPELAEAGPAEIRRLIAAFNAMQARIRRLIDERTRALAAVGHDLRTPLARLQLRTDAIPDADLRREVAADIEGMEAMVNSLLAFLGGEADPEVPRRVDLAVLCASLADDASDHGHAVRYEGPAHLEHRVRPSSFRRAVTNLVDNAVHHGRDVVVRLEQRPGHVYLHVEDDGPGIPEESLALVLEPFVRLDAARGRDTAGFGLGLSIVARAVAAEGGTLELANRPAGGLRATIALPG
ncbi:two-component sensor histidine kinase [Sphingomonas spermidinifaciens]|uniref:histidine kinase n=2 Tax=Sphingomonas spermidinifaciens TaxID=1141889 RepID=A0A2A4B2K1_9SPHN|nr:ATP-binding protein [Sphingomonas spermidinifaciens]PCD02287.1 two-component sensor histidine kinase [Sphingomonas spermidinifaciens]